MAWRGKQVAGVGCGLVALAVLVLLGALAWHSRELNREYRELQESENALVAALGAPDAFAPPAEGVPDSARVAVFVGVRAAQTEWRDRVAAQVAAFRADRAAARGPAELWRGLVAANELATTLAGFWRHRNETLRERGMAPGEYAWLYGTLYYVGLGHDPQAGRTGGDAVPLRYGAGELDEWERRRAAGPPPGLAALAASWREALAATWNDDSNPVELIFAGDAAAHDGD